jgi:hypothetical protein
MAGDIVYQPESSTAANAAQPPPRDPFSDDVGPATSSSNSVSGSTSRPRTDAHQPHQPLRYVESSASSSGDEIRPLEGPSTAAPFKKSHHGKYAYSDRYNAAEYVIEQLSEYDDIDLVKPWHRKLIMAHPIVIVWVFLTYAAYYGYRVWCNYQFRLVFGGLNEASWIFICVEGVILCRSNSPTWIEAHADYLASALLGLDGRPAIVARQPKASKASSSRRRSTDRRRALHHVWRGRSHDH